MLLYSKYILLILIAAEMRYIVTDFNEMNGEENLVVRTSLGPIRGTKMRSFNGKIVMAFRGIPYAQPPLESLRFQPPRPLTRWLDVINATKDSAICPQPSVHEYRLMSEDCLTLNIYTSNIVTKQPVIVYIHGGLNVIGSGHSEYEAGPQYLLDHNIVFVSFNYRLGLLGFLSTGEKTKYPGNNGYLDQQLVLKWVQEHISNFGGDPSLVTLLGVGSGAMAVTLHLASPMSNGLFQRAIMMSGSATNHYSIDNVYWTRRVARDVRCPMYDPIDVVDCLRQVSWPQIIEVCERYEPYEFSNMKWNYEIDEQFMPNHPTQMIDKGNFTKVPLLVSITKNELDFTANRLLDHPTLFDDIMHNFDDYAPELFLFDYEPKFSHEIKKFYFGKKPISLNSSNIILLGIIFSDAIIGHGVHRLIHLAKKHTTVYYYRMDYIGSRTLSAPKDEHNYPIGIAHNDDHQYVLAGSWYGPEFNQTSADLFMVDRLTRWFVNFAKFGKPEKNVAQWRPCDIDKIHTLYNDVSVRMGEEPYAQRYALWDRLFPATSRATDAGTDSFCIVAAIIMASIGLGGISVFRYLQ